MASTYGWLWGKAHNAATRCGGRDGIRAKVQTWNGSIEVLLSPDGEAKIYIRGKIKLKYIDKEKTKEDEVV